MKTKRVGGEELLKAFAPHMSAVDLIEAALSLKISNTIIAKRNENGMSQSDLAEILNVKQPVVSKWESGDVNYTIRTIVEIFDALKIDYELLIGKNAQKYHVNDTSSSQWVILSGNNKKKNTKLLAEGA